MFMVVGQIFCSVQFPLRMHRRAAGVVLGQNEPQVCPPSVTGPSGCWCRRPYPPAPDCCRRGRAVTLPANLHHADAARADLVDVLADSRGWESGFRPRAAASRIVVPSGTWITVCPLIVTVYHRSVSTSSEDTVAKVVAPQAAAGLLHWPLPWSCRIQCTQNRACARWPPARPAVDSAAGRTVIAARGWGSQRPR